MRKIALSVALGAALVLAAWSSAVASNFGTRGWPVTPPNSAFGGLVSLSPPTGVSTGTNEIILFRGDFEGVDTSGRPGLAQGGYYTSGTQMHLDTCGASSTPEFYTETKASNTNTFVCTIPGVPTPGAVYTVATWHTDGQGEFVSIFRDGGANVTQLGPLTLGFRQGFHAVGGEINSTVTGDSQNDSHGSVFYGAGNPWTVYRGSGLTQPGVVQDCSNTFPEVATTGGNRNNGWSVPCPPTPFTISH